MQSTISKEIKDRGGVFCACSTAKYRLEDSHLNVFITIYMHIYMPIISVNLLPIKKLCRTILPLKT